MTTIQWPSDELPGPVPVRLEVPDGWLVEPAPNVSFVAASPTEVDGVHANIVVTVRRIDSELTLDQVTELVGEQLADLPGVSADAPVEMVELSGGRASLRRVRIEDPASGAAVGQVQLVTCVRRADLVSDAVTVTLTHAATATAEAVGQWESALRTLSIG